MENVTEVLIEGKINTEGIIEIQRVLDENKKLKEGYAFEKNTGKWDYGIAIYSKEELKDAIYSKYERILDECSELKDKVRRLEGEVRKK